MDRGHLVRAVPVALAGAASALDEPRTGLNGLTLDALRITTTFALATLSYYLVERPIRRGALGRGAFVVTPAAFAGVAAAVLLVAATAVPPPLYLRNDSSAASVRSTLRELPAATATGTPTTAVPAQTPVTNAASAAVTFAPCRVLLIGDSVMDSLSGRLALERGGDGVSLASATLSGCGTVVGEPTGDDGTAYPWAADCSRTIPGLQSAAVVRQPTRRRRCGEQLEAADRILGGELFGSRPRAASRRSTTWWTRRCSASPRRVHGSPSSRCRPRRIGDDVRASYGKHVVPRPAHGRDAHLVRVPAPGDDLRRRLLGQGVPRWPAVPRGGRRRPTPARTTATTTPRRVPRRSRAGSSPRSRRRGPWRRTTDGLEHDRVDEGAAHTAEPCRRRHARGDGVRVLADVDARWCERWRCRSESRASPPRPVVAGCRWCRGSRPSIRRSSVTSSPRSSSRGRRARTQPTAPVGNDGKYSAVATSTAPYTTRAVVMRPINPTPFQRNGRRGVVERQRRRRRGPGLDARTQRTGTRRLRLGRRLRAEGRCRRAQVGRSAAWRCRPLRQPVAPG